MRTYEDGVQECKRMLLGEAEAFDHAAAHEGDSNPGKIFAGMAQYFRMLVTRIEERETILHRIGDAADGDTALGEESDINLWYKLRRELETSSLPREQMMAMIEEWITFTQSRVAAMNGRQEG